MIEKGLISFIKQKLDHSVDPANIKNSLMRAGFPEKRIDAAFEYVKKVDKEAHQKAAAENDFLPVLRKGQKGQAPVLVPQFTERTQRGLFSGRLLRRDFILGFLFFFGLGYIILVLAGVFLSTLFPNLWNEVLLASTNDTEGLLLLILPLMLLPVTVMLFSLITRRLHNLGIPGGISFIFLILFISPTKTMNFYGLWVMYAMVVVLFLLLITKKGDMSPNEYGPYPSSRGSFFKRIFNV